MSFGLNFHGFTLRSCRGHWNSRRQVEATGGDGSEVMIPSRLFIGFFSAALIQNRIDTERWTIPHGNKS